VTDPFTALGVAPRYDLDLAALERQHRALSRALHPDRYAGRAPGDRREALGRAIAVNQAWRVLRDPVGRAEALLETLGLGDAEPEPPPSPEYLAEMMDERETLAEARAARDLPGVQKLASAMREKESALVGELSREFTALGPRPDPAAVARLRQRLGELRYCRRYLEEASTIEDDLL
jgi:molecular chaperone HscB